MTTTALTDNRPPPRAPAGYAVTVRRARALLQLLLVIMVVTGLVSTVITFFAVQDTLGRYQTIVADSAYSADAAQAAREAVLAHHSAAAEYLSRLDEGADPATERVTVSRWQEYQEAERRLWQNRSDEQFGEFAVFDAADRASLRYRGAIDAMFAFVEAGDREQAEEVFLESHQILIRELLPALNGLEGVKLESMEAAYATTSSAIARWQRSLLVIGGIAVGTLLLAFFLTRYWLHYAWTWELVLASVLGVVIFAWFNVTLLRAASEVEVLVRRAYDTVSSVQSVEALLTQADALESMALFDQERASDFLRDADDYLFLLEQQLCGDRDCTEASFVSGATITEQARDAALVGQQTYGLPRAPLVASAYENRFEGEAVALERLRGAIQAYRAANRALDEQLQSGDTVSDAQREASEAAYNEALAAADQVRAIARATFDRIYREVTLTMGANRWLAILFTGLALLGFWGLRRRRDALFP